MDKIKIEITSLNPLRGKEVNPIKNPHMEECEEGLYNALCIDWEQAELNRREFDMIVCGKRCYACVVCVINSECQVIGSIHSAEIISEGKVKIL